MVSFEQAARQTWDVLVVGAGPAGALAARQIVVAGATVLLVDKAAFGRWKVCGCCLNASATATLASVSLGDLPVRLGAVPFERVRLIARGCQAEISLPKAVSLSRNAFDAALIEAGVSRGVHFLPETHATLGVSVSGGREVILTQAGNQLTARAKLVLAADGLGSQLLAKQDDFSAVAELGSRIGAGVVLESSPPFIQPGTIYMACSSGGYVGLVTLEDGRLNVAAALDRETVRVAGGLGEAAADIISAVGLPKIEGIADQGWRGTAALTRQASNLSCERVFVLGDAAGYVEPFTGEGIAWALGSAVAIVPLALRAVERWDANLGREWSNVVHNTVRSRQGICRAMAWGLRHPRIVRSAITMLRYMPSLAVPVVRRLNAPA